MMSILKARGLHSADQQETDQHATHQLEILYSHALHYQASDLQSEYRSTDPVLTVLKNIRYQYTELTIIEFRLRLHLCVSAFEFCYFL